MGLKDVLAEPPRPQLILVYFTTYVLIHELGHAIVGGYRGWFAEITWRYGFPHPWIGVYVAHNTIASSLAGWVMGLGVIFYIWQTHSRSYALIFLIIATIASLGDILDTIYLL